MPVAEWLDASATYYNHYDRGSGGTYTSAVFSPGGFPLSFRTTEYGINRASTDCSYYAVSQTNRPDVTGLLKKSVRSDF